MIEKALVVCYDITYAVILYGSKRIPTELSDLRVPIAKRQPAKKHD